MQKKENTKKMPRKDPRVAKPLKNRLGNGKENPAAAKNNRNLRKNQQNKQSETHENTQGAPAKGPEI